MSIPPQLASKYPDFAVMNSASSLATMYDTQAWKLKIGRAWSAYNGVFPNALKVGPGAPNDNVNLSLARVIVDKSTSFLFGRGLTINLDKEETRSPVEKWFDDCFDYNQMEALFQRLSTNGGIYGHVFVKIRIESPFPRMIILDPSKVSVVTAPDDYTQVNEYRVTWENHQESNSQRKVVYRQRMIRVPAIPSEIIDGFPTQPVEASWQIIDQRAEARPDGIVDDRDWVTIRQETWPFPFAPVVDCQNLPMPNDFWGQSDIEPDVIGLIESANRAMSNINKIIRNHAHPRTVTIGLEGAQQEQFRMSADGVLHLPGDKTQVDIKNLEMQSDLASSLAYYEKVRDAIYELSRTPEVASGKVQDLSYLSAMAMQILYGPMMEKTRVKRLTYGYMLQELCRRLGAIAGKGNMLMVDIVWPDTFPRDAQVESLTAMNKLQVGFSKDTIISELDGNPEYERERRKADMNEAVELAQRSAPPKPIANGGNTQPRGETPPATKSNGTKT
jgi:hypothetical protein